MSAAGAGTHGIGFASEGAIWLTEIIAEKLTRFDPLTKTFNEFDLPSKRAGLHTLAFDKKLLWVTEQLGGRVARMDLTTGAAKECSSATELADLCLAPTWLGVWVFLRLRSGRALW